MSPDLRYMAAVWTGAAVAGCLPLLMSMLYEWSKEAGDE